MKRNKNKGFSMVELIIVVAMLAVLMALLAPQYIRYVEKTRIREDDAVVKALIDVIMITVEDTDAYETLSNGAQPVFQMDSSGGISVSGWDPAMVAKFQSEAYATLYGQSSPKNVFKSREYKNYLAGSNIQITYIYNANLMTYKVLTIAVPANSSFALENAPTP